MSYRSTSRYKISNWRAYNQAQKQRGSLTVWFDADMVWLAKPSGKRAIGMRPRIQALSSVAKAPNERWSTDLCRVWAGKDGQASLALVIDCHTLARSDLSSREDRPRDG